MGIRNAITSKLLENPPENEREMLELFPGGQNELWDSLINVRLQFDGNYRHARHRGGLVSKQTFFGQIRTFYGFSASANNTPEDYIVVHTATGAAYLLNKTDHIDAAGAPDQIFADATFNTSTQITIFHSGNFVYLFDFTDEVFKVYDIENDTDFDWLANQSTSITSWSWKEGVGEDWTKPNIWGFEKGREIIVLHNFNTGSYLDPNNLVLSYRSFKTKIEALTSDTIVYLDPGGISRTSGDSADIGIINDGPDLSDFVDYKSRLRASGDVILGSFQVVDVPTADVNYYLNVGGIRVPETGILTAAAADTQTLIATDIEDALNANPEVVALWDVTRDTDVVLLERENKSDVPFGIEFEAVVLGDQPFFLNANNPRPDQSPQINDNYTDPVAWRGYLVVDLLADGAYAIPGRPESVFTSLVDIIAEKRTAVNFTLPAADSNVEKRYLFCTRWQTSQENVFTPSRPEYPNNAFFLCKELEPGQTTFTDATPDRKLFTALSSFIPMGAGITQMFGAGQLTPKSAADIESALLIGGYTINRPVPEPYDVASNPDDKNVFTDFSAGTNLTDSPELSVLFEYTDGKKSSIIDTAKILTDAEVDIVPTVIGTKATAQFWTPTNPPGGAGNVTVSYPATEVDEEQVVIPYLGTDSIADLVNKVVSGINADGTIQITADPFNGATEVGFTEKRTGSDKNGNIVRVDYPADGISATVEMEGGEGDILGITVSGNQVQLHSLNALVTKVYLLAKFSGAPDTYKLIGEVESTNGQFHGQTIYLPNSDAELTAAESFTPPVAAEIRTVADLPDYVVAAIPYGQPLITEQARIKESNPIRQLIATQFDVDKSQMRFRITVFTDRNVQVGYLLLDGNSVTFDFEIIGKGVALTHKYGAWYVEGSVIYQADDGIYEYSQQSAGKIVDRYQYDVLGNDLQAVLYNRFHKEYWFIFANSTVLVTSPDGQHRKRFVYPSGFGPVRHATYVADDMVIGIGTTLYTGDVDGADDAGTIIEGQMISNHIGDPRTQAKIMEVAVGGQDLTAIVELDMQRQRLERSNAAWTKEFASDVASASKTLRMHGTPYPFAERGVMPKIRIKTEGENDGFISHISLTHIILENKGKAR